MTERGTHRSAGVVDVLLAATAELSGLALVHYDHDFEEITKVTGQTTVWLAEPGSIACLASGRGLALPPAGDRESMNLCPAAGRRGPG